MFKGILLLFSLLIGFSDFGLVDIDYQNKRLIAGLKKQGIAGISELQEIHQDVKKQNPVHGKFFSVANGNNQSAVKYVYVGRIYSCRAGGCCSSTNEQVNAGSEYFEYFMFFDASKTVIFIDVFNYQATHGYEVTARGWLKQFVGYSGKDTLIVNKNIDSISGATISVHAITSDVQLKTSLLQSMH